MKNFLYIIFVLSLGIAKAQQNLIYNGSFEEYSLCPGANDLNNGEFEKAKGWWKSLLTPDYYNSCSVGIVGTPSNFWGYQMPFEGDGYVGFVSFAINLNFQIEERENFSTKIKEPLKNCYDYRLSYQASLGDVSTHGVQTLHARFSKDSISTPENSYILEKSDVITDTSIWQSIVFDFNAEGEEKFLTIGYLRDNVTTDTTLVKLNPLTPESIYSGYYVDSVQLFEQKLNYYGCKNFNPSIPNFITPNLDSINDNIDFTEFEAVNPIILIYNRWGNVVTELKDDVLIWDGKDFDGKELTAGIYFYRFEYTTTFETNYKTGYIHLIR